MLPTSRADGGHVQLLHFTSLAIQAKTGAQTGFHLRSFCLKNFLSEIHRLSHRKRDWYGPSTTPDDHY